MLKIKDNVDLKVLEKYGFKFERGTTYIKPFKCDDTYIVVSECDLRIIYIEIDIFDREYEINQIVDILYDLIQAGLVEKVEVTNNE